MYKTGKEQPVGWQAPQDTWSARDGKAVVAAYEKSELSIRAIAKKYAVPEHRVSYWRAKLAKISASGFATVEVRQEPKPTDDYSLAGTKAGVGAQPCVEVCLRNGRSLRLTGEWDQASVHLWVKALENLS